LSFYFQETENLACITQMSTSLLTTEVDISTAPEVREGRVKVDPG